MTTNLRIGIPNKGRLADTAAQLLREAGLSFRHQDRSLFARCREMPIDVTFLRTDDIPTLCAEGAIDLGVTGSDLVTERAADVVKRLELGIGHCRLAICIPDDADFNTIDGLNDCRIATSFPHVTEQFLARHEVRCRIVPLSGSVEVMIALGVADAIVDLVETGSTLAANRLKVLADIGSYQGIVVQNRAARHAELADRVVRRLEGVVIARSYSLLEYNVPRARLAEAEQITPGFSSPTVSALEDPQWCAVRVMVRRSEVISAMERLEQIGAVAILEMQITNCRL